MPEIFVRHLYRGDTPAGVVSNDCYQAWCAQHKPGGNAKAAFRYALLCHLTGTNDYRPFHEAEERLILEYIRKTWPRARILGFHERLERQGKRPRSCTLLEEELEALMQ